MQQRTSQIRAELKNAYGKIARDFSDSRARPWPEFKILASTIPDGSKVLDLGCGNGRFYGYLNEHGKDVDYTGVDFTKGLLAIAKKKYPRQDFVEQDITDLELPRRFDRIVCVAAFHHIPSVRLRKKTLKLMIEHLEDNGVLLISVWNLWQWKYIGYFFRSFLSFIGTFFRHDPRDVYIPFGKEKIPRFYHAFLPFEMRQLLQSAGLTIERSEISHHNSLYICRKNALAGVGNPLFVSGKKFAAQLNKTSAMAASQSSS